MRATAFCDGRGNCATGSCATIIIRENLHPFERAEYLGECTNNYAEYMAILLTMRMARFLDVTDLTIYSDSKLIVNQLLGDYKINHASLLILRNKAWEKGKHFDRLVIKWIPREQNTRADYLCHRIALLRAHSPLP